MQRNSRLRCYKSPNLHTNRYSNRGDRPHASLTQCAHRLLSLDNSRATDCSRPPHYTLELPSPSQMEYEPKRRFVGLSLASNTTLFYLVSSHPVRASSLSCRILARSLLSQGRNEYCYTCISLFICNATMRCHCCATDVRSKTAIFEKKIQNYTSYIIPLFAKLVARPLIFVFWLI